MANIEFPYELVKILLSKQKYSQRYLANELRVSKNTIQRHICVMQSLGLVEIKYGRLGGTRWIAEQSSSLNVFCQKHIFPLLEKLQNALIYKNTMNNEIAEIQRVLIHLEKYHLASGD